MLRISTLNLPLQRGSRIRSALLLATSISLLAAPRPATAFCGFYVAKADTRLFNEASQVVLVRDGNRTVITMVNDFRGAPEEFAVVVPVPTFLEREQIHVAEKAVVDHLDAYTSPRLVEYFDENPCHILRYKEGGARPLSSAAPDLAMERQERARSLGVTIEASYSVGEYDILILSAEESQGLTTWLRESGYRIPEGAEPVINSYLKQKMRFFVARVNLEAQETLGTSTLRPLQIAYESPKFMLPIRLGTVNADGQQELFVYTLTRKGRVETTNYRTVKLPTGMELPTFLKASDDFGNFYRDMFRRQVDQAQGRAVFLEYAWDMAWCDPCAAEPLTQDELRRLGVFWLPSGGGRGPAQDVFVTRLHLRYDRDHFPEDLRFQETADRTNFQGRYVLRHAWTGSSTCDAANAYAELLPRRYEQEARQLASLTGWKIDEIRDRMGFETANDNKAVPAAEEPWWKRLWGS